MNIEHGLKDQEQKSKHLKEDKAFEILKIYGFNVAPYGIAHSLDEAIIISENLGFPLVLKIISKRFKRKLFRFRKKF
jgi:acyl-CoA synthetase (NDP forming)